MKPASLLKSLLATLALAAAVAAQAQTVVKVGSTPTGIPFTFLDTKTNTIEGMMVDAIKAVGKEAGFEVQIEAMPFSALIGSLTSKRIDIISAAMFITPARQEVIDFSQPLYSYGEGVVTPKTDTTAYTSFEDLKGKRIGAQVGTAFVAPLQKSGLFSEVRLYDTGQDMLRDANAARIDAAVLDAPIAAYMIQQGLYPNLQLVRSYKPTVVGNLGIATRKGETELMARINQGLDKIKVNGTLDAIYKKWGLQ
ncbi:MAG: putative ABC transporter arginine-binding protein 2 [Paracidovorax wautersii]|uniref:Putative ABC transporter arginine-binding protein 2 n=1 Tax=Paracidovorax wautersii TaxID=1177982 RepID=A0A7V8FNR1_9BURK|nr:MAG: putative ABC transporter arginine-binding protein 2 [Paracidovorax wautersii]